MIKVIWSIILLTISAFLSRKFKWNINWDFISSLTTIFSILFGFYVTSFSVFAGSRYLSKLYKIEDAKDNRKTLLDNLLSIFSMSTYFLLSCIVYLIVVQFTLNNCYEGIIFEYFRWLIYWVTIIACISSFRTISVFIKIIRQSAKQPE